MQVGDRVKHRDTGDVGRIIADRTSPQTTTGPATRVVVAWDGQAAAEWMPDTTQLTRN